MSGVTTDFQERCVRTLARDPFAGGEQTLREAYELGREALAHGAGVMEMGLFLWRAARAQAVRDPRTSEQRIESFLLEGLSPFEMAFRAVGEANETLRRLDGRREEEARRVARELHDQAGQLLATVHLALEGLRAHLAPEGEAPLGQALELLRVAEDEIRRLSRELRPTILDDLGLAPALRFLADGVARRWGIEVHVDVAIDDRPPHAIETAVYRTVQEALNNVVRHARASAATIEVRRTDLVLCCRVRDDGIGFDPASLEVPGAARGLGIEGIRERLAPLRGALEVSSRPGLGTEVAIHIPLGGVEWPSGSSSPMTTSSSATG